MHNFAEENSSKSNNINLNAREILEWLKNWTYYLVKYQTCVAIWSPKIEHQKAFFMMKNVSHEGFW